LTTEQHLLRAIGEERVYLIEDSSSHTKCSLWSLQQDGMVHAVKCCREIEQAG